MRLFKGITMATLVMVAGSFTAEAGQKAWTFKDWQVHVESVDTGEDLRVTCTIQTVGNEIGKARRLYATISNGDAMPPHFYPSVILEEIAAPGTRASLNPGDPVSVEIDHQKMDIAPTNQYQDEQGRLVTEVLMSDGQNPAMLRAMKAGQGVVFRVDLGGMQQGAFQISSLSGFTASYLKMAEQCGFPADL